MIILVAFLAVLSLPVAAAAEPPANVTTDGNHFYQEISVNSTAAVSDATIFLTVPYPFNFSGELKSYRFYDADGNPLPAHVFAGNTSTAQSTIKLNLTAGTNTIWVTAGNGSLPSTQDTSVYKYYAYNRSPTNGAEYTGLCNGYLYYAEQNATGPAGSVRISFGANATAYPRFETYYTNASRNDMLFYPNSTGNTSLVGSNMNQSGTNIPTRVQAYQVTPSSDVLRYTSALYNNVINRTQNKESYTGAPVPNFEYITYSTTNTSYPVRISLACAYYNTVSATYGDWIETDSIAGVYIRVVDSVTGQVMDPVVYQGGDVRLGGTLDTSVTTGYHNQYGYQFYTVRSTTITAFDQIQTVWDVKAGGYASNSTTTFQRPTSVVYFPIDDIPTETHIDLKPQASASPYNNSSNSNEYNISISPRGKIYSVPLTHSVRSDRTGLFGQVVDQSGNPVPNATVTYRTASTGSFVNSSSTLSGGMFGYANFTPTTSYYINVDKVGYISNTTLETTATVNNSRSAGVIVLKKLYNITITVVDADSGSPINTFTTFLGPDQSIKSTDNGSVTYNNTPGGETEVIIQADGYNQVSRAIYIGEGSTDFTLSVSKSGQEIYDTPNYVRFFYRTYTGVPISGLTVTVSEGNNSEIFGQGITGQDGSVSFRLDRTIKYTISASNSSAGISHSVSVYPKSSEYIIFLGRSIVEPPSEVLSTVLYSMNVTDAGEPQETLSVNLSSNATTPVSYNIVIYTDRGEEIYKTANGSFVGSGSYQTSLDRGGVYIVSITFTDATMRQKTVSQVIRLDDTRADVEADFQIPGFTQQWHYSTLCVFIVTLSGFTFSARTKRIGGLIIPGEMLLMGYMGWIDITAFAICLMIAVVIMAIVYFADKAGSEESIE